MAKAKVLAVAATYRGVSDVLFMMNADDFRLADPQYGYTLLAPAKANFKTKTLVAEGRQYRIFSDWTVRELI